MRRRAEAYAGWRRYREPLVPGRVFAACVAFGLVVGLLFVGDTSRLYVALAGLVVALYVAFGGRPGGRPPGAGTFAHGGFLLALCAAERVWRHAPVGVAVFAVLAAALFAVAWIFWRMPGRGGVIR